MLGSPQRLIARDYISDPIPCVMYLISTSRFLAALALITAVAAPAIAQSPLQEEAAKELRPSRLPQVLDSLGVSHPIPSSHGTELGGSTPGNTPAAHRRADLTATWTLDFASQSVPGFSVPEVSDTDDAGNTYVASQETRLPFGLDIVIRKISPDGVLLWEAVYSDESGSTETPTAILATDNAVYLTLSSRNADHRPEVATVRYDADGSIAWIHRMEDPIESYEVHTTLTALAEAHDGNIIVAGWVDQESDPRGTDLLLIKYAPDGTEVWRTVHNTEGSRPYTTDGARAMAVDTDGNILIAGSGSDSGFYTAKFDSSGSFLWGRVHPRDHEQGSPSVWKIASAPDGSVYVSGTYRYHNTTATTLHYSPEGTLLWEHNQIGVDFSADLAVGPDGLPIILSTRVSRSGMIVTKITLDGETAWTRHFGGPGGTNQQGEAHALVLSAEGNAYATGYTWDGTSPVQLVLIKVSADGELLWDRTYLSADDRAAVGFELNSTPNGVRVTGTASAAWYETVVLSYDHGGKMAWDARHQGEPTSLDAAIKSTPGPAGTIYVTGQSWTPTGGYDLLTLKLTSVGNVEWVQRHDEAVTTETGLVVTPTPDGVLSAGTTENPDGTADALLLQYDSDGGISWQARYPAPEEEESVVPVDVLPDGVGGAYVLLATFLPDIPHERDSVLLRYDAEGNVLWEVVRLLPYLGGIFDPLGLGRAADGVAIAGRHFVTVWYDDDGNYLYRDNLSSGGAAASSATVTDQAMNTYVVGRSASSFRTVKYYPNGERAWINVTHLGDDSDRNTAVDAALAPQGGVVVAGHRSRDRGFAALQVDDEGEVVWTHVPQRGDEYSSGLPSALGVDTAGRAVVAGAHYYEEKWDGLIETLEAGERVWDERIWDRENASRWGPLRPPRVLLALDDADNAYYFKDTKGNAEFAQFMAYSIITVHHFDHQTITPVESPPASNPSTYLLTSYPNPTAGEITLSYSVSAPQHVRLVLYDMLAREVAVLVDEEVQAGQHVITFDGRALASGIYPAVLTTRDSVASTRLVLLSE